METWIDSIYSRDAQFHSLLAREINWMETYHGLDLLESYLTSLLAREINWMETKEFIWSSILLKGVSLYSLEKLIEWKLTVNPLNLNALMISLYSLEKLIEWKL